MGGRLVIALGDVPTSLDIVKSRFRLAPHPGRWGLLLFALPVAVIMLWPWIVASHHATTAITEGDQSVGVLSHQRLEQPASDLKPRHVLSRLGRVWHVRNSHVGAPQLRIVETKASTA